MNKNKKTTIEVKGAAITVLSHIEFLGIWEQLNNPEFKPVEFDGIRMQAGLNSFTLDGYELKTLDGFLKGLGYLA